MNNKIKLIHNILEVRIWQRILAITKNQTKQNQQGKHQTLTKIKIKATTPKNSPAEKTQTDKNKKARNDSISCFLDFEGNSSQLF